MYYMVFLQVWNNFWGHFDSTFLGPLLEQILDLFWKRYPEFLLGHPVCRWLGP